MLRNSDVDTSWFTCYVQMIRHLRVIVQELQWENTTLAAQTGATLVTSVPPPPDGPPPPPANASTVNMFAVGLGCLCVAIAEHGAHSVVVVLQQAARLAVPAHHHDGDPGSDMEEMSHTEQR